MGAKGNIAVGSQVWAKDPDEVWIDGTVLEVNKDSIRIQTTSGKTINDIMSNVHPKDPNAAEYGVDDMTKLAHLHEPGVLQNIKSRYALDEIYTYAGNILIAVNPFKRLPELYNEHKMQNYIDAVFGDELISPHLFAVANAAYRMMIKNARGQSIIVSGESGSGKTESTKYIMQYLAFLDGKQTAGKTRTAVVDKVLRSNQILEAFGNAKTANNNNSSRFAKYVEIQYDKNNKISGAKIRTYLLEKSRVSHISDLERNYHCFYMLCAAPPEDRENYGLEDPTTFDYLNKSKCYKTDQFDETKKEYLKTREAMDIIGISRKEQEEIFQVVAGILHLGNIKFEDKEGDHVNDSELKDEQSRFHLKKAAELLKLNWEALKASLFHRVMSVKSRGDNTPTNFSAKEAAQHRDALAKIIYSALFDWLVNKINNSICQNPDPELSMISILDISGFECFKTNSFEQLCINYTHEKLQQHFYQHVVKKAQDEFSKEGINWSHNIDFTDNQDVLDILEKGGIIARLDESCMSTKEPSVPENFAQKLYTRFGCNKKFARPKLSHTDFIIHHDAGDVRYQTDLFLEKNKDSVVSEHQVLLNVPGDSFVSGLFPSTKKSLGSPIFSSMGQSYEKQLRTLMEKLSSTEPHYIRCVKPNNLLKPADFNNKIVCQQLKCGHVMEAIKISRDGFPTQMTFYEFIDCFGLLAPDVLSGCMDERAAVRTLLEKANLQGYQIGKTKVFLRASQMAELDACKKEVLGTAAGTIQRKVRSYHARKSFLVIRKAAIQIQTICRGEIARRMYQDLPAEAATEIGALRAAKYKLEKEVEELKSKYELDKQLHEKMIEQKNDEFAKLQAEGGKYKKTKEELDGVQEKYKKTKEELDEVQDKYKKTKKELDKVQEKYKKTTEELDEVQEIYKKTTEDLDEVQEKYKKTKEDLDEVQEQYKKTKEELDEVQEKYKKTKEELDEVQEKYKKTKEKLDKVLEKYNKTKKELDEVQDKYKKTKEELDKAARETEALQAAKNELEKEVKELRQEYNLEKELHKKLAEQKMEETTKLQAELKEVQEKYEETKEGLAKEREAAIKVAEVPSKTGAWQAAKVFWRKFPHKFFGTSWSTTTIASYICKIIHIRKD